MGRNDLMTRGDVEDLIARGDVIIIFHDKVIKINSWLPRHPGGELLVRHFIGRDATLEIEV